MFIIVRKVMEALTNDWYENKGGKEALAQELKDLIEYGRTITKKYGK